MRRGALAETHAPGPTRLRATWLFPQLGTIRLRVGRRFLAAILASGFFLVAVPAQETPTLSQLTGSPPKIAPVVWQFDAERIGTWHTVQTSAWCTAVVGPQADGERNQTEADASGGLQDATDGPPGLRPTSAGRHASAKSKSARNETFDETALAQSEAQQVVPGISPAADGERELAARVAAIEAKLDAADVAAEDPRRGLIGEIRAAFAAVHAQGELARQLEQELKSADARAAALQQKLASPPAETEAPLAVDQLSAAEAAAAEAAQVLSQLESQLETAQAALQTRPAQKAATEQEIDRLQRRLAELRPGLAEGTAADDDAALPLLAGQAQRLALQAQLTRSEITLQHIEGTLEVLTLERDWAQRRVQEQRRVVESLERAVARLRQREIHRQVQEAESAKVQSPAAVRSLAERNADLIKLREQLLLKIEASDGELRRIRESLETVRENRNSLENKIQIAGMNRGIGLLMRQQIMQLPDRAGLRKRLRQIERELPPWQLLRFDYADERDKLADVHALAQQRLAQVRAESEALPTAELEAQVTGLVQTSQQLTLEVLKDLDRYIDTLSMLNLTTQQLEQQCGEFSYFVEKHVLWIRSADPLGTEDLHKTWEACARLVDGLRPLVFRWYGMLQPQRWPLLGLVALGVLAVAAGVRFLLRRQLARAADGAAHSRAQRRAAALRILALSLLLASFWPAMLGGLAEALHAVGEGNAWAEHLASSLWAIVPFVWCGHVVRSLTLRGCVAELYFGWPRGAVAALHRMLYWYLWTVLPPRCAGMFFDRIQNEQWASSAGRTMFIVSQISLFLCLSYALREVRPVLVGNSRAEQTGALWQRTRRIWPTLLVLLPLLLAVLSLIGFHYSASVLTSRFGWTLWIILGAIGLLSVTKQVIAVVLHQISVRNDRIQQAAAGPSPGEIACDDFDTVQVSNQLSRLLGSFTLVGVAVATYFLWAQVLPAVQILDQVELWSHRVQVAETIPTADGSSTMQMVTRLETVTLVDAGWCAVVLLLTLILSRNLPGLLELTLLERLPVDRGGKYAISVVCRYLVAIAGILLASSLVGVRWTSVQWLVAAMSVGLGFGLQEIFGNFVSGIIILLERPVRMGDLVTVNGTTGWVTRVQLRATTITDFDRRETIVPNKTFITADVVNWTLTDPITRLVVPVGIAYGSDTERACETLMEIAKANPFVLNDPEPCVVFTRFGASSLDLELRVFIPERQQVVEVQHGLHMEIDRRFREEQIEIAFPQQDIHIRSLPAAFASPASESAAPIGQRRAA